MGVAFAPRLGKNGKTAQQINMFDAQKIYYH